LLAGGGLWRCSTELLVEEEAPLAKVGLTLLGLTMGAFFLPTDDTVSFLGGTCDSVWAFDLVPAKMRSDPKRTIVFFIFFYLKILHRLFVLVSNQPRTDFSNGS
jgi:hypothetical protein